MTTLADFSSATITGEERDLSDYVGQVVLVVNTASKCGFAPQFDGLEKLYADHRDQGFIVLGFPCDQFKHQEFDEASKTLEFCQLNYGVDFPMFAKIDVNGPKADPLYTWLKQEKGGVLGDAIKWNFTKFLLNRKGEVVKRYAPATEPADIEADILELL